MEMLLWWRVKRRDSFDRAHPCHASMASLLALTLRIFTGNTRICIYSLIFESIAVRSLLFAAMFRTVAPRILSASRYALQSSTRNYSSKRVDGSLSQAFLNLQVFVDRREEKRSQSILRGNPSISLSKRQIRAFTTREHASPSTTSNEDEQSFRQRMEGHRDRGRKMANKGANSLKAMIQKYGKIFVVTYFAVYFSTLASLFAGIESGVLDPAYLMSWVSDEPDAKSTVHIVVQFMEKYSWLSPYVSYVENNPEVANLAIAWIAVKFTEPIRFGATVAIVPPLSRYLGYSPPEDSEAGEETDSDTVTKTSEVSESAEKDQSHTTKKD